MKVYVEAQIHLLISFSHIKNNCAKGYFDIRGTMAINWTDPYCKITKHFTVAEALWLHRWNRMASVYDGFDEYHQENLIVLFQKMELVRAYFGRPIHITSAFRPYHYNRMIGGAVHSAHTYGMAADWHISGLSGDICRYWLVRKLHEWDMRCENSPRTSWVHLDIREPSANGRFFRP